MAEEKRYRKELEAEMKGVSYSKSLEKADEESDDEGEEESDDEDEDEEDEASSSEDSDGEPSKLTADMALSEKDKIMRDQLAKGSSDEQMKKMSYMLLPRKKRELYKAMQLGIAKKEKRAAELTATRLRRNTRRRNAGPQRGRRRNPSRRRGRKARRLERKSEIERDVIQCEAMCDENSYARDDARRRGRVLKIIVVLPIKCKRR